MRKIIVTLFFMTLIGCATEVDDLDLSCNSECTKIKGKFVTQNNEGVPGVRLILDYRTTNPPFSSNTRLIRDAVTDSDGYYELEFYINDDELGNDAEGYFRVNVNSENIDTNNMFKLTTNLGYAIYSINRRDTIIDMSFYLPKKEYITVNLYNFSPIDETDFFEVRTFYPFGLKIGENQLLDSEYATGFSGYGTFKADSSSTTFENIPVAVGEYNVISILKRKNATTTATDTTLFIGPNNNLNLNFEY